MCFFLICVLDHSSLFWDIQALFAVIFCPAKFTPAFINAFFNMDKNDFLIGWSKYQVFFSRSWYELEFTAKKNDWSGFDCSWVFLLI